MTMVFLREQVKFGSALIGYERVTIILFFTKEKMALTNIAT